MHKPYKPFVIPSVFIRDLIDNILFPPYRPFSSVDVIVFIAVFLYGDIRQMDEHVVQLVGVLGVLDCAKSAEAQAIHVAF